METGQVQGVDGERGGGQRPLQTVTPRCRCESDLGAALFLLLRRRRAGVGRGGTGMYGVKTERHALALAAHPVLNRGSHKHP